MPIMDQITIFEIINRAIARTSDPSIEPLPDAGRWHKACQLMWAAPELLERLKRLADAAFSRDVSMGDPCAMLEAKDNLARATREARETIAEVERAEDIPRIIVNECREEDIHVGLADAGGIRTATAGEKIDPGDVVYWGEDGKVYKAKGADA